MDFPTLLVLATAVTGLIWALDVLLWAPKRRARAAAAGVTGAELEDAVNKAPYLIDLSRSFFPVILIVLVIRSFVVEPFRIPSGSMMPTLLVGDFILVNKFAYGLRLPVLNTKFLNLEEPQRGDVIVFRYPEDPRVDYIKRVIGVPGDTISYRKKVLSINGVEIPQKYLGSYVGVGSGAVMTGAQIRTEQLTTESHEILVIPQGFEQGFDYTVGAGQYFVMGDNRDNSRDSRFWGTVPEGNLVGKAFFVWMNWDSSAGRVDWSRIGNGIN